MHYPRIAIALLMLWCSNSFADQESISAYNAKARAFLYSLYFNTSAQNSADIYCGIRFKVEDPEGKTRASWLSAEHAYAAKWMVDYLGCGEREACRKAADTKIKKRFNHAEADLHNLWPALVNLNSARGDKLLAEIPGDETKEVQIGSKTFSCEFQSDPDHIEPRKIVRGNLARSIFYMCKEYGFPVDPDMLTVLKKWNRDDPPTQAEKARNNKIEKIQGTRNPFIDKPSRATKLQCAAP